jgi:exodeoxyribonuclease VII small subunit
MNKKKEPGFEESLLRLQEISELLEKKETRLEDSMDLYEEGITLAQLCYKNLKNAELRVTELKKQLEENLKG